MSEVKVNKVSPRSGTALTVGDSGDTVTVTGNDIRSDAYKASDGGNIVSQSGTTITLGASGDTVEIASGATLIGGGISWQSAIKTTSFTAVGGEGYWVDTTSGAVTVTLPASAAVGDQIILTDYARNFATNNLIINTNSLKYQGTAATDIKYTVSGQSVDIVYSGGTKGWIPNSDDDVEFKTSATINFLILGGGGCGGAPEYQGGGGGAGGLRASFSNSGAGASSEQAIEQLKV